MRRGDKKTACVVCTELAIAATFIVGPNPSNPTLWKLYHSYFADIAIPFGFYFLLVLQASSTPILVHWWAKAAAVLALCAASETLQYFGIYALARVFDPVDFLMYSFGVLLAAFIERQVFARLFGFWDLQIQPNNHAN